MVHQKIKVRFPAPHESYSLQSLTYATANQNHHDNLPYAGQACGGKSQKKDPQVQEPAVFYAIQSFFL